MPVIAMIIPRGAWETKTVKIGPCVLGWGPFLSDLVYYIIVIKTVLKMQ
jgi:large conductance mechanosensitive channel